MDPLLLAAQLTLSILGVVGVAASEPDFALKHFAYVLSVLLITLFVSKLSPLRIVRWSPFIYLGCTALLVLVLFIGVSPAGSDARRWLDFGLFTVQPSELMKVGIIAYLAAYFHNHRGRWRVARPIIFVGIAVALIAVEPNISTALLVFCLGFAMMLAAGATIARIAIGGFLVIALLSPGIPYMLNQYPYISERVMTFLGGGNDPDAAQDEAYQANRAKHYLNEGGLFGRGVGEPNSLPASDTDMIAVSIGHALGLVGTLTLLTLYIVIGVRGLQIASSLKGPGALLAFGATCYICGQAALNLLVASGRFPITGVPLPFVSVGINSLISVAIAMGFLQSAYRSSRVQTPVSEAQPLRQLEV